MKTLIFILLTFCCLSHGFTQNKPIKATMTSQFYEQNKNQLFWVSSLINKRKASDWLKIIEASEQFGLNPNKKIIHQLQANLHSSELKQEKFKTQIDLQITTEVLNFLKDFQEGNCIFTYNEISISRDSVYIFQLLNFKKLESVSNIINRLESKDHDYLVLKRFLNDSLQASDTLKSRLVALAMNYRKFLSQNSNSEYIIANIPTAQCLYFKDDCLKLSMKAVMGGFKHQTPTLASYLTGIVTFPYWNVPHSIAVLEILPKAKADNNYLEMNNLEIIDARGNQIDESELNWNKYNEYNFPYYFRQATGTENALGILKFNLENPFSIYLHGTNWQGVFAKENRFLSHGCVRLENPYDLAEALSNGEIDIEKLKTQEANSKPKTFLLPVRIPTYLIYSPAIVVAERVIFYPDFYKIINY